VLAVDSRADGRKLSEQQLDAAPEFDALAAAGGKLFLWLEDGTVLCLGAK